MDNNQYPNQYPGPNSPMPPQTNGKAVAALVMGIIACASFWIPIGNTFALVLSVIGLVLAIGARKVNPSGIATAALVLCIIGLVITGIGFVTCTLCVVCFAGTGAFAEALGSLS